MIVAVIGERGGFPHTGGVLTLAKLLMTKLEAQKKNYVIATSLSPRLRYTHYIALGCSSPWAYSLIARSVLFNPTAKVHWIPCFHPPRHVRHKYKALMARFVLRLSQRVGVTVWALSSAEQRELDNGSCHITSLPFEYQPLNQVRLEAGCGELIPWPARKDRIYDLTFLGRPLKQKGWHKFLSIVDELSCRAQAIVPYTPFGDIPSTLELRVGLYDNQILPQLANSKILFMPSDYESFGFAQAEALGQGCCVPVLGQWPLWTDIDELQWQDLTQSELLNRLRTLIANDGYRELLVDRQRVAWASRPERNFPSITI